MSSKNALARIWSRIMIFTVIMICVGGTVGGVISMTTEEETSVVRAKEIDKITTHEVLPKAKMPEVDVEQLDALIKEDIATIEESSVRYSSKPNIPENCTVTTFDGCMAYEYTVQPGDTLWEIADRFFDDGCFYPYIMEINALDKDTVYQGQKIIILEPSDRNFVLEKCYSTIKEANKKAQITKTNSKNNQVQSYENMTYVGNFKITGYDPWCSHCCGKSNGVTASGAVAKVGVTIASNKFPMGTKLYIEGYGTYTVQDRGGMAKNVIDMAAASHEDCYKLTASNVAVYKLN